jgi:hypothetical protein
VGLAWNDLIRCFSAHNTHSALAAHTQSHRQRFCTRGARLKRSRKVDTSRSTTSGRTTRDADHGWAVTGLWCDRGRRRQSMSAGRRGRKQRRLWSAHPSRSSRAGLQGRQDPVVLLKLLRLCPRDEGATVHVGDYQALRFETAQCLPHRRVTHVELLRELTLTKRGTGRDMAVGDEFPERVSDHVALADVVTHSPRRRPPLAPHHRITRGCRLRPSGRRRLRSGRGRPPGCPDAPGACSPGPLSRSAPRPGCTPSRTPPVPRRPSARPGAR